MCTDLFTYLAIFHWVSTVWKPESVVYFKSLSSSVLCGLDRCHVMSPVSIHYSAALI